MTKVVTIHAQQKWDHCTETRRSENAISIAIGERGQLGWELVSIIHYKDPKGEIAWTAFMKRPSVGQAPGPVGQTAAKQAESPAQPQGFDLSGDEFKLKTE
jgi:hypothetical protein